MPRGHMMADIFWMQFVGVRARDTCTCTHTRRPAGANVSEEASGCILRAFVSCIDFPCRGFSPQPVRSSLHLRAVVGRRIQ